MSLWYYEGILFEIMTTMRRKQRTGIMLLCYKEFVFGVFNHTYLRKRISLQTALQYTNYYNVVY